MDIIKMEELCDMVCKSDFYKRFAYKGTWLSGSSTTIYSVMVWKRDIEIQLDGSVSRKGRAACFRRLMARIKKVFPKVTSVFWEGDGSCPATYSIYYNA